MTHFVPRRETNNTTTTKREKEEVITARVSFPSVPLERKWWCEYSSLSLGTKTRASIERYIFSLLFLTPRKERTEKEEERKEEEREGEEQFFSREKDTRKNTKKKKKPLINFAPTPGTCTRKQMKEGTERENGVNAGDACVRF